MHGLVFKKTNQKGVFYDTSVPAQETGTAPLTDPESMSPVVPEPLLPQHRDEPLAFPPPTAPPFSCGPQVGGRLQMSAFLPVPSSSWVGNRALYLYPVGRAPHNGPATEQAPGLSQTYCTDFVFLRAICLISGKTLPSPSLKNLRCLISP